MEPPVEDKKKSTISSFFAKNKGKAKGLPKLEA